MTTTDSTQMKTVRQMRPLRIDLGVACVVLVALALGFALRYYTLNRTSVFQDTQTGLSLKFPAAWGTVDSLQDVLLKVEDPQTDSAYKTNLIVEARDLDAQNPPTLQDFVDRRVAQKGNLTGYHFIGEGEAVVDGEKARQMTYAYTVQPNDQPRRVSLPVVVVAREYIVIAGDRVYYLTVAAPETEFAAASTRLDTILQTVNLP